jgi:hypothetical protein
MAEPSFMFNCPCSRRRVEDPGKNKKSIIMAVTNLQVLENIEVTKLSWKKIDHRNTFDRSLILDIR